MAKNPAHLRRKKVFQVKSQLLKLRAKISTLKRPLRHHLSHKMNMVCHLVPAEMIQMERIFTIKEKDLIKMEDQKTSTDRPKIMATHITMTIYTKIKTRFILWGKSIRPKSANISKILVSVHLNSFVNSLMGQRSLDRQTV